LSRKVPAPPPQHQFCCAVGVVSRSSMPSAFSAARGSLTTPPCRASLQASWYVTFAPLSWRDTASRPAVISRPTNSDTASTSNGSGRPSSSRASQRSAG
jgi:hypothetical protein